MLWLLFALLLIVICLLLWILFQPVIILIDTDSEIYQIRQKGTFAIALKDNLKFRFKVMGIEVKPGSDKRKQRKKSRKGRKRAPSHRFQLLRSCLTAIRVRKLIVDIDTDDVVLNAQLIPLAWFLSNKDEDRLCNINFEGTLMIYLLIEIRLYLILKAFVKHTLKTITTWK